MSIQFANLLRENLAVDCDRVSVAPSRVAVNEKQNKVDSEKSACTPQPTQMQSYCSKLTCTAAAGLARDVHESVALVQLIRMHLHSEDGVIALSY